MAVTFAPLTLASGFPHMRANSVLVRGQGGVVLVDCGGKNDEPALLDRLAALGISPSEVELLVLTHLHYDHCENVELFERARLVVHWREIELLERLLRAGSEEELCATVKREYQTIHPYYLRTICYRLTAHRAPYLAITCDRGRLLVADGDAMLQGNLEVLEAPGHSPGHLVVRVSGARPVWIVGDAVISREDHLQLNAMAHVCWDRSKQSAAAARVSQAGEPIVPGHGAPFDPVSGDVLTFDALG